MKKISYIGERPSLENMHAGSKARMDIDVVLEKFGCCNEINIIDSRKEGFFSRINYEIKKIKSIMSIKKIKGKFLVLQYPYYISKVLRNELYKKTLNNKVILIIHDINSIRDGLEVKKEVELLNQAYLLIVHNQHMLKKLSSIGVKTKMVCLELFDYVLQGTLPNQKHSLSNKIIFAGNLGKSKFLETEEYGNLNLKFCLYGPNYNSETMCHHNTVYCGSYYPDEIPYKLEGGFGLIWDGDTVTDCKGLMGKYTRYNNPHKLSMYIAAGLPVIVWREAAIASFVEKNKIGFVVNDLTEIEKRIEELDENEYNIFLVNIRALQSKVCSGYFTIQALYKLEEQLDQ